MEPNWATILSNKKIAEQTYMMELQADTSTVTAPGQFINIRLDGFYLRRPMSIADWTEESITIIYRVVGGGTKSMSGFHAGTNLDILIGLGNGFDITKAEGKRIVLIGGSLGVAPLIGLARKLKEKAEKVSAVIGFGEKSLVFGSDILRRYTDSLFITTVDGSVGKKGLVTAAIDETLYDYYFTCGNEYMLRAIHSLKLEGQLSFEARMGCGFGACMGCSCRTLTGYKRICMEGPIMLSSDISYTDS